MTIQDQLNQFIVKWNGKYADYDGVYGAQCVDLAQYWSKAIGGPWLSGNYAYQIYGQSPEFYESIPNTPIAVPQPGDMIIWSKNYNGYAGHIGICRKADLYTLEVFEQNDPAGTNSHLRAYTYNFITGFMRPRTLQPNADDQILLALAAATTANNAIVTAKQTNDPQYATKILPVKQKLQEALSHI